MTATTLTFLGAAGTVTGSRYLVDTGARRILVDCGLFQGLKSLRLRNWAPLPIEPRSIDAVVLTHAHLDHSGYLPLLIREGFRGPVYCTAATRDLCRVMLPDSGHLQEEEAEYANRHRYSKHAPALPLYTRADAEDALGSLRAVPWDEPFALGGGVTARLLRAGHMLGAAMVHVDDGHTTTLFSGDLGRPHDPILHPPVTPPPVDRLVVESTYGDRRHDPSPPAEALAAVIRRTAARGGVVLVPAFAVGRTQTLLHFIDVLKRRGAIPHLPVFLNSPMAIEATELFDLHHAEHRLSEEERRGLCSVARLVRTVEESKWLNSRRAPMVIIAGSGMATGGRILHHLRQFAPDHRSTILFVGYQAEGTRGARLVAGERVIKMLGREVEVRAVVAQLGNLSGHADADETLAWLRGFSRAPEETFITHGNPEAAAALRERIARELGWNARVARDAETVALEPPGAAAAASP